MPRDRAQWNNDETRLLLHLCLQEKEKFNFNLQGLTISGWNNIYTYFPHYDKKQCNNKLSSLKAAYNKWKDGQTSTGLGRDPCTGDIDAEPEY
jgi:GTPase SAR1 family protein